MSDLITPPEAVEKLDAVRRPHRLAASDGGGVIFPNGFFGPGYYLPEWEFLRYCSRANHLERDPQALTWWQRHILRPSPKVTIPIVIAVWVASYVVRKYVDLSVGPDVALACFASIFYWRLYQRYREIPKQMSEHFPAARRLTFYRFWWAHVAKALRWMKASTYASHVLGITVHGLLTLFIIYACFQGQLNPVAAIFAAPPFAMLSLYLTTILASFAAVRLLRGKPSTQTDPPPVAAPIRDP